MASRYELHVKDKGRTVFPVDLRNECGFEAGTTLIARPLGPGRALIETTEAILESLWAGIPEEPVGAVESLLEARRAEAALEAARAADPGLGDEDSDAKAAALLQALGLV